METLMLPPCDKQNATYVKNMYPKAAIYNEFI